MYKINYIDVGSYNGLVYPWKIKYIKNLLRFDPHIDGLYSRLKSVRTYNCFLSDRCKDGIFYSLKKKTCSSLFKPNMSTIREFFNERKSKFFIKNTESIKCIPIKNILKNESVKYDFVKLDTQGSDLDILIGFGEFLKYIKGIEVEVFHEKIYSDIPLAEDVDSYLVSNNFEFIGKRIKEKNRKKKVFFSDFVYLRKDVDKDFETFIGKIYKNLLINDKL